MYQPNPVSTEGVELPSDLIELREQIASHVHDHWALLKIEQGHKEIAATGSTHLHDHEDLVPYEDLEDTHKEYDRRTAESTIKLLIALGYQIVRPSDVWKPLLAETEALNEDVNDTNELTPVTQ